MGAAASIPTTDGVFANGDAVVAKATEVRKPLRISLEALALIVDTRRPHSEVPRFIISHTPPPVVAPPPFAIRSQVLAAFPGNRCVKHFLALKEAGKLDAMSEEDLQGLYKCIKTGLENGDSGLGCYAMQPSDYDKYAEFFDAVNNDYHNNPAGDKIHKTNWCVSGAQHSTPSPQW